MRWGGSEGSAGGRGRGRDRHPLSPGLDSPEIGLGELLHVELLIREWGQVDVADRWEHVPWLGGAEGPVKGGGRNIGKHLPPPSLGS